MDWAGIDFGSVDWLTVVQWFSLGALMAAFWVQIVTTRHNRRRTREREEMAGNWSRLKHGRLQAEWDALHLETTTALASIDAGVARVREEGGCPGCMEDAVQMGLRFERLRRQARMEEWSTEPFSQPTVWEGP